MWSRCGCVLAHRATQEGAAARSALQSNLLHRVEEFSVLRGGLDHRNLGPRLGAPFKGLRLADQLGYDLIAAV